jgi:hypothetical protein
VPPSPQLASSKKLPRPYQSASPSPWKTFTRRSSAGRAYPPLSNTLCARTPTHLMF